MISISHYLYRKLRNPAIPVLLTMLSLCAFAPAQLRDRTPKAEPEQPQAKKPAKRGPRAIGVLEFLPGGGTRLVPVALWIDGHYYDASLYGANPEPMALEPETMYQAMSYGEPTGWFTVTTPKQINGNWVADGKWKSQGALDTRLAEQAAKQSKPKPSNAINDDQGPPVLRRAAGSNSDAASATEGSPPPSPAVPASGPPPASASGNAPPPPADDPDRPTLKMPSSPSKDSPRPTLGGDAQPTGASAASPTPPNTAANDKDPDRPVLMRGKQPAPAPVPSSNPTGTKNAGTPAPGATNSPSTVKSTGPATAAAALHAYPAISDAGDYVTRPMLYPMTPAEREERARSLLPMAVEEIRNFASKRNALALPKTVDIADYDVRAFDLDFSNSPTLVLTAKLPPSRTASASAKSSARSPKPVSSGAVDYFVTVVARLDLNGQPVKIFSSVTDSNHLDAYPRLQIIDAVDADANGRGVLLFRQYADGSVNYALYRVFPYQMVKVFEGGAGL